MLARARLLECPGSLTLGRCRELAPLVCIDEQDRRAPVGDLGRLEPLPVSGCPVRRCVASVSSRVSGGVGSSTPPRSRPASTPAHPGRTACTPIDLFGRWPP